MFKKLFTLVASVALLASCSDKVYEDLNTDPTKADHIDAAAQLTYAQLQMYGDMNYNDIHRLYTYAFTQQLMGCWNTTNYGGQNRKDDNEMLRAWNNLYEGSMRNLTDAIEKTKDDPGKVNVNAALRIMRVYVASVLTDIYGDVPYTEAGLGFLNGNIRPKYDTQKDIYMSFFPELQKCVGQFDASQERISSDALFNGDLEEWKNFANSLCLRYAMRIYNVEPDTATKYFAMALEKGTLTQDAVVKHMNAAYSFGQEAYTDFRGNALSQHLYGNDPANNPSYICYPFWQQLYDTKDPRLTMLFRFYIDDFMSLTAATGREDITEEMLTEEEAYAGSIGRNIPGNFSWDEWPAFPDHAETALHARLEAIKASHPGYDPSSNPRWTMPKLANNFLQANNPGVIMTQAEVDFLIAEATVRGMVQLDAKTYYEAGIKAAMQFLVDQYGCQTPSQEDIDTYLANPSIVWGGSSDQQLAQINTQAWILHFHNPNECWANIRRSNLPKLKTPTEWGAKNPAINGEAIPVRLEYPMKEQSYNGENCADAKARVEGGYNWNAPIWWDK